MSVTFLIFFPVAKLGLLNLTKIEFKSFLAVSSILIQRIDSFEIKNNPKQLLGTVSEEFKRGLFYCNFYFVLRNFSRDPIMYDSLVPFAVEIVLIQIVLNQAMAFYRQVCSFIPFTWRGRIL